MKTLIALVCAAVALSAQDPRIAIENEQTKTLKVVSEPHQKTKMHEHKVNRVMIYLQAGKQDFSFEDGKKTSLQWKAGEAKWSPAGGMHVAEITSNNPVTIVEIELKKPASGAKPEANTLDPVKLDPKHYKVDFENAQVRVLRVKIGAHETAAMHKHALNRVVVYLTDQKIRVTTPDGKQNVVEHKAGDVSWGTPTTHREENLSDSAFDLYAVEIKN